MNKRYIKGRRLLGYAVLLLCAVVFFCAIFTSVSPVKEIAAAISGGDGSETNPYIMTSVADWKSVIDRASSETDPTYVQLGADITASGSFAINGAGNAIYNGALNVPAGKYINLDLKNFKINRGLTSGVASGHVFVVYGNLTIDGETYKVASDGRHTAGVVNNGGGITGGYTSAGEGGGGFYVPVGGTLIMNGGSIYNCYSSVNADAVGGGGGVHVRGKFILNNGYIHDCATFVGTTDGGAVSVGAASTTATSGCGYFEMNGGALFDCSAFNHGGAVDVSGPGGANGAKPSTMVMNGGEIYANTASTGYALSVGPWFGGKFIMNGGYIHDHVSSVAGLFSTGENNGTIELNGGVISGNKTTGFLCAISSSYNNVSIGGGIQIFGNKNPAGTVEQNLTLGSVRINITGDLGANGKMAHVGVTFSSASVFTTNYGKFNPNVSASNYFFSDNASRSVTNTVTLLGATNEATLSGTAQTTNKIVWKYKYEGDADWKLSLIHI